METSTDNDGEVPAPAETSTPGPVSRRDFLRRTGRDAVDTGTRIIPGGQIARAFLNGDKKAAGAKPGFWDTLLRKRADAAKKDTP